MRISDGSSDVCSSDLARRTDRPAAAAGGAGGVGAARDAALSTQSAFPVQHAEQNFDAGAAQAVGARQRDAVAPVRLPALHARQRADRAGDAGAGDRDDEAISRHRKEADRGAAAPAFRDRPHGAAQAPAVAAAPATGRKYEQKDA